MELSLLKDVFTTKYLKNVTDRPQNSYREKSHLLTLRNMKQRNVLYSQKCFFLDQIGRKHSETINFQEKK